MANQFYEERIPIPRFSLGYDNHDRNVALVRRRKKQVIIVSTHKIIELGKHEIFF